MSTRRSDDRVELLQETLNLLILRTLRLGPDALARAIGRILRPGPPESR